jgi:hypothetical protein
MYTANKHSVVESRNAMWHDMTGLAQIRSKISLFCISFFVQEPTTLDKLPGINDQEAPLIKIDCSTWSELTFILHAGVSQVTSEIMW